MSLKLARSLIYKITLSLLITSSNNCYSDTVVQSFLYTQIFGTSLVERYVVSNGPTKSVYILVPNTEPRITEPTIFLGTADSLDAINGITVVKQDINVGLAKILLLLNKHLVDIEPVLIIHDTTRASQILANTIKTQLASYKPDTVKIESESHLRRVLSERPKTKLLFNLVTSTQHEESGTKLLYKEVIALSQQWVPAIDISLVPTSSICLCIDKDGLIAALKTGSTTLTPTVRLNVRALQNIGSRLYIDAIKDIDSVELRHAD
jgi:hypothetical protein